jgi:hypothetical protein
MQRVGLFVVLSLVILLPLGCAKATTRKASYSPSQQWEYKVVKLEKDEDRDLTTLLNVMARDGWEFNGQITTGERHIVFKRSTAAGSYGATMRAPDYGTKPVTIKATATAPKPATAATEKAETGKTTKPAPVPKEKPMIQE